MLWFLPFLVVSQLLGLNLSLPTGNGNAAAFRSKNNAGVALNNRKKVHGEGEKCPRQSTTHCTCRSKKSGLDITCEDVDSDELHEFAKILKSSSTDHLIRYFKIRNSNIPHLDDYLFMGMKIEHLYIHDCNMKSLGPTSISSQGNTLKHLVLSKNKLSEVPTRALKHLTELEHLNLNENQIQVLRNEAFTGLSKVTRLSLYHNHINTIEQHAFDGIKRWHEEPENFSVERDMQRLNLAKNKLSLIPHDALSGLAYLETLELSDNPINQINEGDFNGLDNLDHLIMNSNALDHLGANYFSGLPKLTTLYLDHNQIKQIHHEAFVGLESNLQSLSLAGNDIEEFPSSALKPVHELTTLHLDDNRIKRIDDRAFEGFGEHIKYLWLQNNQIKNIPATAFQDLHSLEWIKLYNNLLTTLHYELMEPVLDTLQHIDIHSNPLICDCELRWYHQWIEEEWNPVEEGWLKETFCKDPADNQRHNIAEVPLKDMFCTGDVTDKPSARDDGGGGTMVMGNWILLLLMSVVSLISTRQQKS